MKSNKEIIIEGLTKSIFKDEAIATMVRREDLPVIATTLLSKLQILDRKKVEQIFWNNAKDEEPESIYVSMHDWDEVVDQICQLILEKGVVIAEGEVEFFGTIGARWGVYKIGGQYINEVLRKAKTKGKKGKLIFIEEKKE